ncbi:MAG TPA: response regulator transcription factor [Nitrospira sp.]|nr:response regulator transcription factor [Nitrospira sp.]
MKRLRILLVDDRVEVRSTLRAILEPAYHVVGEAEDGQAAVAGAQALRPDLALLDVDMPVANGIETVRELHRLCPECRLILYGSYGQPDVMAAAFAAGASGYVIKGCDRDLFSTIQAVIRQLWKTDRETRNTEHWASSWLRGNGQIDRPAQRIA